MRVFIVVLALLSLGALVYSLTGLVPVIPPPHPVVTVNTIMLGDPNPFDDNFTYQGAVQVRVLVPYRVYVVELRVKAVYTSPVEYVGRHRVKLERWLEPGTYLLTIPLPIPRGVTAGWVFYRDSHGVMRLMSDGRPIETWGTLIPLHKRGGPEYVLVTRYGWGLYLYRCIDSKDEYRLSSPPPPSKITIVLVYKTASSQTHTVYESTTPPPAPYLPPPQHQLPLPLLH